MRTFLLVILVFSSLSTFSQLYLNTYYGNLHSHTSFSDGMGTPADAYLFARDSAHLDFLAVTDHIEYLDSTEFSTGLQTSANFTSNGVFVAFYGYEWTSPYYGHCDIFNTEEMIPASSSSLYPGGWDIFTAFMRNNPPAFGQFNHPGRYVTFNNWDDFAYVSSATDSIMPLIEFQNIQEATNYYEHALSKGWHLSPVWNQDNHQADWGLKNNGRAGIWATSLSKQDLINSIKHRRTFATMDFNASVWIESGSNPMGSTSPLIPSIPIRIILNDADNELWTLIELVSDKGVLDNFSNVQGNIDSTLTFSDSLKWVFVRATQQDSDMIWSAPVFFQSATNISAQNNKTNCDISIIQEGNNILVKSDNPARVRLTDMSGKTMLLVKYKHCGEIFIINLEEYPDGFYNVTVSDTNFKTSKTVIKTGK